MREVLYRAWDLDNKVMVYHNPVDSFFKTMTWHGKVYKDGKLLDYIMLEWTGLRDTAGVRIFEGDLLRPRRYKHKSGWILNEVVYHRGMFCVRPARSRSDSFTPLYKSIEFGKEANNEFEVVGNIYENQELLKGE